MSDIGKVKTDAEETPVTLTRVFNAPRDLVWKAWTDPELFKRWWGPAGFTSPTCKIDLRVGGKFLWCMRSPEGKEYWNTGSYREIAPPSLLIMAQSFADENGDVVPATHYGFSDKIPAVMVITVRLQEIDNKTRTKMILTHAGLSKTSESMQKENEQGWNESLDKLEAAITAGQSTTVTTKSKNAARTVFIAESGKQEVTVIREFNAPRELVFKAFTDPSLYVKWLGPRGYSMKLEKFEPKTGGSWRYIHKDPNGVEFGFHGVYHEVSPPERLIDTFEFEGLPEKGHVSLETATFEALPDRKTKLTIHAVYLSVADRDGMVSSGMEGGMNDSFERLTELLAKLESGR